MSGSHGNSSSIPLAEDDTLQVIRPCDSPMLKDLSYAFRMLRKTPGFTIVAILSLALGTGANSAMFSFVDALLLRPLLVLHPSEVLTISGTGKTPDDPIASISY